MEAPTPATTDTQALALQAAQNAETARLEREAAKAKKDAEKAEKKAKSEADKAARLEAKAKKDAEKAEKKAAAEAKKAEKEANKAAKVERVKQPQNNGVTRPKPETKTGKVWELADTLSQQKGAATEVGPLLEACKVLLIPEATVRTQYAAWRKFNGVVGRIAPATAAPTPEAAPQAPEAPAPV